MARVDTSSLKRRPTTKRLTRNAWINPDEHIVLAISKDLIAARMRS